MRKFAVVLMMAFLLCGCGTGKIEQGNVTKIEVSKGDNQAAIEVDHKYYGPILDALNRLTFEDRKSTQDFKRYYAIYITEGDTIHSYYLFHDGIIQYEKNSDKKILEAGSEDIVDELTSIIDEV